mgnify:CR=1 FL=1
MGSLYCFQEVHRLAAHRLDCANLEIMKCVSNVSITNIADKTNLDKFVNSVLKLFRHASNVCSRGECRQYSVWMLIILYLLSYLLHQFPRNYLQLISDLGGSSVVVRTVL